MSFLLGYVPYQMWAEADPRVMCMLQTSLRSFRHELLVANFAGVPVLQQHGSADSNVPAFHSRRMNQLVSQSAKDTSHDYSELEGRGHWYDGVMTSLPLRKFYANLLGVGGEPKLPQTFSIVVSNPADMGPRGGLVVDQMITPDQLGKIDIAMNPTTATWVLRTSNIRRFHFSSAGYNPLPHELIIDETQLELPLEKVESGCWLLRSRIGIWQVSIMSPEC
jgi:hypothetical protein